MITCPHCQYSRNDLQSKAKRPRIQCPKCGKKSELKYWKLPGIPKITPVKKQSLPSLLSREDHTILDLLLKGYFASTIARDLSLSNCKVHRIIQKLIKTNHIESIRSYPKIYKLKKNDDQTQNESEKTLWPTTTDIHCIRFKIPLLNIGNLTGARSFSMGGWTKYLFTWTDHPELDQWKIEVNTKCVVFDYTPKILGATNAHLEIEKLKANIPVSFLMNRGFTVNPQHVSLIQDPHCVFQTQTKLDGIGSKTPIKINDAEGKERWHADNSDDSYSDGIETTIEHVDKILDVPEQLKALQQQITTLAQTMMTFTQQMSQFLTSMTPKSPPIPVFSSQNAMDYV